MNQDSFVKQKKKEWEALSRLVLEVQKKGIDKLSQENIKNLGSLYRRACADLAYAKSHKFDSTVVGYLNDLVRQSYGLIYSEKEEKGNLLAFFLNYPNLLRKNFRYILLAFLIFFASAFIGFVWDKIDPAFSKFIIPNEFLRIWESPSMDDPFSSSAFPILSSMYLVRNFKVGLMAFVTGFFLGFGTLYYLSYNGIVMGALTSMVMRANHHTLLFGFILPHAFIELTAIFICGGAGFLIAKAILFPEDLSIRDSLYIHSKEAVQMALGTIPLFLLAGAIESSISRWHLPLWAKILIGFTTILSIWLMFTCNVKSKREKYGEGF